MPAAHKTPWPLSLKRSEDHRWLCVAFEGGESFDISAELLRVYSPSAEVQGHNPDQKQTVPGKRDVRIEDIQRVGNYAVRLVFSDHHSTGIFSWTFLYDMGQTAGEKLKAYEAELAAKGLSRD